MTNIDSALRHSRVDWNRSIARSQIGERLTNPGDRSGGGLRTIQIAPTEGDHRKAVSWHRRT